MRDAVIGLTLTGFAAALYFVAIPGFVSVPPGTIRPLTSPQLLPQILAGLISVLGLAIAVAPLAVGASAPDDAEGDGGNIWQGLAIVLGAIVVYVTLVEWLGAILVAIVVTLALLLVRGEQRWPVLAVAGVAIPTAAVLLLQRVGNVPLPDGLLAG